ncbi:MAG TPA: cytochrome c peroxidase [Kofleriaceae bacterium]|nr:cytochrome c peroxidase [Kofleriaceae bacterium]
MFVPVLVTAAIGCVPGKDMVDEFTAEEFDQIRELGPLPDVPPDPTNRYADDPAAAAFGQRLFFEKSYSHALTIADPVLGAVGDKGKIACASCHDPNNYYVDTRSRPNATSLGVTWTTRNAPSLVNTAYYRWASWGGKEDTLWYQGANGCESGVNFGGNRLEYAHMLFRKYRADYDAIFPVPLDPALDPAAPDAARFPPQGKPKSSSTAPDGPWELMASADRDIINQIMANIGKAIEAYERKLISRNAPIDRYIAGDYAALSPAAKRGLRLFIGKAACVDCHAGPAFTDQDFHNTGVPQVGLTLPRIDNGRFDDLPKTLTNTFNAAGKYSDDPATGMAKLAGMEVTDDLKGKFRTSSLRQIDRSGPYMHTGSLTTLNDVVQFYNWGGGSAEFSGTKSPAMVPLLLTNEEASDLVEFLGSLTGDPVPAELGKDTAIPD